MKTDNLILACFFCLMGAAACSISRTTGPGRPIGTYDYVVVSRKDAGEYTERASSILNEAFVVLQENDPRLNDPLVRNKTCAVSIDRTRGFWSSSGTVEVTNYDSGAEILESQMRRGMVWAGSDADVIEALQDVAAARAAGPPIPPDARNPVDPSRSAPVAPVAAAQSKAQRLTQLNDLRTKGLVTESEYKSLRTKIINEQ
jgi:hypothetical protein